MSEGLSFFRCEVCSGVVNVWDIQSGGCPKCGNRHIVPTNLSFFEKVVQLIKHPFVWDWPTDEEWKVSTLEQSIKERNQGY